MRFIHKTDSASSRRLGNKPRAFTAVELVVSVGIFMAVATFVTLTISQALGSASAADRSRAGSTSASDMLASLSSYPYPALLSNDFMVPSPCVGTAEGIAGKSCVARTGADTVIGYYYQDAASKCPSVLENRAATGPATAQALAAAAGKVGLCAIALDNDELPNTSSVMASASVNAPWMNYDSTKSQVSVKVNSTESSLPSGVYLVSQTNPTVIVSGPALLQGSSAVFANLNPATQCTQLSPCMVALSPSTTPTRIANKALFGASASPFADIVTAPGQSVTLNVTYGTPAAVSVNVSAPGQVSPPATNTVCLTFRAQSWPENLETLCNTEGNVTFDSVTVAGSTFPLSPTETVDVFLDSPTGVCTPGNRTFSPLGVWSSGPVCTSWTWGTSRQLPTQVRAPAALSISFDAGSPAAGLALLPEMVPAPAWTLPRVTPACATSGTCVPVTDTPELTWCPGQACLSVVTP